LLFVGHNIQAQVDEVTPAPIPADAAQPDVLSGKLGNEYAQWWARTGALSRCPILPHPSLDWSDDLRAKAKRTLNRFTLEMTLRPFKEMLQAAYQQFANGEADFGEVFVTVWQKCDPKMRAAMVRVCVRACVSACACVGVTPCIWVVLS
jgi:hypothetical protein